MQRENERAADGQKGSGNIIIAIVNFFIGGILFAVGVQAVREYCVGYDTANIGWLGVSMGVIFMMAALIVLFFAFLGICLTVRGERHRLLSALATLFLLGAWILLPLSGAVAGYYYNAAAPYVRVSAGRAEALGEAYAETLRTLAAERGDTVVFYDVFDEEAETLALLQYGRAGAKVLPAGAEEGDGTEDGAIEFLFSYDSFWKRLTLQVNCRIGVTEAGMTDWAALEGPLAYLNSLSSWRFTAEAAAEAALNDDYADYAWDGYAKQLYRMESFVRIECYPGWSDEDTPGSGGVSYAFCTLTDTDMAAGAS